ncbi:MAG: hypothetical protein JWR75_618 [Devosia sp.]|nr:hypothetical protein [Devosia sp.]
MKPGIAWIIGGGTGIGAAVAMELAGRGWTVAISGRRMEKLQEVANGNPAILPYPLDVTDEGAIAAALAQVAGDLRRIDLFIYGAAAWQPLEVGDYSLAKYEKIADTNFFGFIRMLTPLTRQFERQGGGQLAVIASVAGYFGLPRSGAYGAMKAALIQLCQSLRIELEPKNIIVRMVCPGFVKSELTAKNDFPMPFIMEADAAAKRIVDGLVNSDRFEIAFPRRLVWPMKLMRILPYPLFFSLARRTLSKAK